jgi:hypothetical protein
VFDDGGDADCDLIVDRAVPRRARDALASERALDALGASERSPRGAVDRDETGHTASLATERPQLVEVVSVDVAVTREWVAAEGLLTDAHSLRAFGVGA